MLLVLALHHNPHIWFTDCSSPVYLLQEASMPSVSFSVRKMRIPAPTELALIRFLWEKGRMISVSVSSNAAVQPSAFVERQVSRWCEPSAVADEAWHSQPGSCECSGTGRPHCIHHARPPHSQWPGAHCYNIDLAAQQKPCNLST